MIWVWKWNERWIIEVRKAIVCKLGVAAPFTGDEFQELSQILVVASVSISQEENIFVVVKNKSITLEVKIHDPSLHYPC